MESEENEKLLGIYPHDIFIIAISVTLASMWHFQRLNISGEIGFLLSFCFNIMLLYGCIFLLALIGNIFVVITKKK